MPYTYGTWRPVTLQLCLARAYHVHVRCRGGYKRIVCCAENPEGACLSSPARPLQDCVLYLPAFPLSMLHKGRHISETPLLARAILTLTLTLPAEPAYSAAGSQHYRMYGPLYSCQLRLRLRSALQTQSFLF